MSIISQMFVTRSLFSHQTSGVVAFSIMGDSGKNASNEKDSKGFMNALYAAPTDMDFRLRGNDGFAKISRLDVCA